MQRGWGAAHRGAGEQRAGGRHCVQGERLGETGTYGNFTGRAGAARLPCLPYLPHLCRRLQVQLPVNLPPSMRGTLITCNYFVKVKMQVGGLPQGGIGEGGRGAGLRAGSSGSMELPPACAELES